MGKGGRGVTERVGGCLLQKNGVWKKAVFTAWQEGTKFK